MATFSEWLSEQDDLLKFIDASPCPQNNTMKANNVVPPPPPIDNVNVPKVKPQMGRKRKRLCLFDDMEESPADYLRKLLHRDVERQRRQEMGGLYQTLRSLLPPEHLQGKRSISDHIDATVRYITHMEKRIEELKNKKKQLNELMNPSAFKIASECPPPKTCGQTIVTVRSIPCSDGLEIVVGTTLKGGLSISKVLGVLTLEGISVKSFFSSAVFERQLHFIQAEGQEERRIDQNELRRKLMDLV